MMLATEGHHPLAVAVVCGKLGATVRLMHVHVISLILRSLLSATWQRLAAFWSFADRQARKGHEALATSLLRLGHILSGLSGVCRGSQKATDRPIA
jgi:hypothetical protein